MARATEAAGELGPGRPGCRRMASAARLRRSQSVRVPPTADGPWGAPLVTAGKAFQRQPVRTGPSVSAGNHAGHTRTLVLYVVLEGVSRGFSAVDIRKFVLRAERLGELVELGSLTSSAAAYLEASVRAPQHPPRRGHASR